MSSNDKENYSLPIIQECEVLWKKLLLEPDPAKKKEYFDSYELLFATKNCADWILSCFDPNDPIGVEHAKSETRHLWYKISDEIYGIKYSDQLYKRIEELDNSNPLSEKKSIWLSNCLHCSDTIFFDLLNKYWDDIIISPLIMHLSDPRLSNEILEKIVSKSVERNIFSPVDFNYIHEMFKNPNISSDLIKKILYEYKISCWSRKSLTLEIILKHNDFSFDWLIKELDHDTYQSEIVSFGTLSHRREMAYKLLAEKSQSFSDKEKHILLNKIPLLQNYGISFNTLGLCIDQLEVG